MALTLAQDANSKEGMGNIKIWCGQVTFDASYATGGESFDPTADLTTDFTSVFGVIAQPNATTANGGGYAIRWDEAGAALQVYEAGADGAALDEVANATDLSSLTAFVVVFGA